MSAQIIGYEGTVEYIEEVTEGTLPANPAMLWIGLAASVDFGIALDEETIKYLPAAAETNKLGTLLNEKIAEGLATINITYQEQAIQGFWTKYGLGGTGGSDDGIEPISIGIIIDVAGTDHYIVFKGCRCTDMSFTVPRRGINEVTMTFQSIDNTGWGTSDYISAGSHATESTTVPIKGTDFTALTYDGSAWGENVESFAVKATYTLTPYGAVGTSKVSGYDAQTIAERTLTAEITGDFATLDMLAIVKAYAAAKSLVATIATKTLTMTNAKFLGFDASLSATEKIDHTFTTAPLESLAIA